MRILLSAVACNPERGSEAHFGWNALTALSRSHEVCMLGHGADRAALERARAAGRVPDHVQFAFVRELPRWHNNRIVSRLQAWRDYQSWCRESLNLARQLHRNRRFDLVHHVTLSTWRVATPLWRLGIPLVWGPLGGAEIYPLRLYSQLSPASMAYEAFRSILNLKSRWIDPGVRACASNASVLLASNPETATLLAHLSGHPDRVRLISAAFFTNEQIALQNVTDLFGDSPHSMSPRASATPMPLSTLRLFAGGDIEGRKGIALALQALAKLKRRGQDFHYHVGGLGPETSYLQNLASRLGIADKVILGVPLRGEEYRNALRDAHIYLLPSLRDNAGLTLMEAMLAGCVPVVADCGGPGFIVTSECGVKVPVTNSVQMVEALADALQSLQSDPKKLAQMSHAARIRIATSFSESTYLEAVQQAFAKATRITFQHS